jgi:hypothetical protein
VDDRPNNPVAVVIVAGALVMMGAQLLPPLPGYYVTAGVLVFGASVLFIWFWDRTDSSRWLKVAGAALLIALLLFAHYPAP